MDVQDTKRLDFLESLMSGYGHGLVLRRRSLGGIALYETSNDAEGFKGVPFVFGPSFREVIDRAMREATFGME